MTSPGHCPLPRNPLPPLPDNQHNFNQVSSYAAQQSDAMFSHCECSRSAVAVHFTLDVQGTVCHHVGSAFVKHLRKCTAPECVP